MQDAAAATAASTNTPRRLVADRIDYRILTLRGLTFIVEIFRPMPGVQRTNRAGFIAAGEAQFVLIMKNCHSANVLRKVSVISRP